MSHSQFHSIETFILRHAWLNLWDKHMTTGRINQVTIHLGLLIFGALVPQKSRADPIIRLYQNRDGTAQANTHQEHSSRSLIADFQAGLLPCCFDTFATLWHSLFPCLHSEQHRCSCCGVSICLARTSTPGRTDFSPWFLGRIDTTSSTHSHLLDCSHQHRSKHASKSLSQQAQQQFLAGREPCQTTLDKGESRKSWQYSSPYCKHS